mgnify:CR=1 FL=1
MDKSIDILGNIVNFLVVALVFLAALAIVFKITLKNYNVKSKKIKFYGLFLGMDNRSILAFSLITLNYIFLIWATATFSGLNWIYAAITIFFMIGSDIVMKEYKMIPNDLLYCVINCFCIYVTGLIYDYLTTKYTTVFLLIILGLVILFVFLYFTYMTFKFLNNVVLKQEILRKKEYKKL